MIETTVDKSQNLTIHKCSGSLTEQEILDTSKSFYGGNPTLYTLWDFSNSSFDKISNEFLREMLSIVQRSGSRRQGGRTAVIAPSDLEYGMARMFQIMSDTDDFPFETRVFRSNDEAKQWLLEK
jgi:hypothetical protein